MLYLSNAFSIQMLDSAASEVSFLPISTEEAVDMAKWGNFVSVIGHSDTANVISGILGIEVPCNRASVKLTRYDGLLVAQYSGPRLPEGATKLPEGATIQFWTVMVQN